METINLVLKTLRLAQLEMVEDRQVVGVDSYPFCPSEGGDCLLLFLVFHPQPLEFPLRVRMIFPLHFIGITLCWICRSLFLLRSISGFRNLIQRRRFV